MKSLAKQRGLTLSGFILFAIVMILLLLLSFKMIPAYLDNAKIQSTFETIVKDPEMQAASISDIKASFERRAVSMNNITVISANDIIIDRSSGNLILSASYSKKIPLIGNATLVLEFNPAAPK